MMWLDLSLAAVNGNYTISYDYDGHTYRDRYAVDQGYLYSETQGLGLALLDSYKGNQKVAYSVSLDEQGKATIGFPYAATDDSGAAVSITDLSSYAPLNALADISTSPLKIIDGLIYSDDATFLTALASAAGFDVLIQYGLVDGVYIDVNDYDYHFTFSYVLTEQTEALFAMLGLDTSDPLAVTLSDIGTTTIQAIADAAVTFTVPAAIDTSVDHLYLEDDSGTVSYNLYEVMIDPMTGAQTPNLAATGSTSWSENTLDIVTQLYGSTSGYFFTTADGTSVVNHYIDAGTGLLQSVEQAQTSWAEIQSLFNPTIGFDATGFRASGEADTWISYDTGITNQFTQMTGITTGVPYSYVELDTADTSVNRIHAESGLLYDSSSGAYFCFVAEIEISALQGALELTQPETNTEFIDSYVTGKLDGTAAVHISSTAADVYGMYAFPAIDTYYDGDDTLLSVMSEPQQNAQGGIEMVVSGANGYRYNADTDTLENYSFTAGADGAITAVHDSAYDIPLTEAGLDFNSFISSMLLPVSPNILTLAETDQAGDSYYIPSSGHIAGYEASNLANLGYLAMAASQQVAYIDGSTLTGVATDGYLTTIQYLCDVGTGIDTYETLSYTYGAESLDEVYTAYAAAIDAAQAATPEVGA